MAQPLLYVWRQKKGSSKSGHARRQQEGRFGGGAQPKADGGSFGGTESLKWSKGNKVGLLVTVLTEARGSLAGIPAAQEVSET